MYQRGYGEIKMIDSSPHLMHILVTDLVLKEAIAFTRKDRKNNKGRWTKQPYVHLNDSNRDYYVTDKHIMHKLLNLLNKSSMSYSAYLQLIELYSLELMLKEAMFDGKGSVIKCWVDNDIIVGFSTMKQVQWDVISFTLNEINTHLTQKNYVGRVGIENYDFGGGKSTSLTGTFVNGSKVLSIISHNNNPIIQARYINSSVMLVDTRVFKGALSTLEVALLYEVIDNFCDQLDTVQSLVHDMKPLYMVEFNDSMLSGIQTKHIRKFRDKNKIEKENYNKFMYYFS